MYLIPIDYIDRLIAVNHLKCFSCLKSKKRTPMPRENKNQYPILGSLSRKEMSGYDLQSISKRAKNYYWSDCNPQVYSTLKKLEDDGLVSSRIDEGSGARNRRVYAITKKGLEFYKAWLEKPVEAAVYRDELMLKIANGQHLSKSKLRQHLTEAQEQVDTQIIDIKKIKHHIEVDHADRKDKPYLSAVYNLAEDNARTKLKWVKNLLKEL